MGNGEHKACWLCGANGASDPLDRHHIFGGPFRKKSERFDLCVFLCHFRCHIFEREAVHNNAHNMLLLKQHGQRIAMERFGWSVAEFMREFGRNYID